MKPLSRTLYKRVTVFIGHPVESVIELLTRIYIPNNQNGCIIILKL